MECDDTQWGVGLYVEHVPKPEYLVGLPVVVNPEYVVGLLLMASKYLFPGPDGLGVGLGSSKTGSPTACFGFGTSST
jgi:hypothetical protein